MMSERLLPMLDGQGIRIRMVPFFDFIQAEWKKRTPPQRRKILSVESSHYSIKTESEGFAA